MKVQQVVQEVIGELESDETQKGNREAGEQRGTGDDQGPRVEETPGANLRENGGFMVSQILILGIRPLERRSSLVLIHEEW